jgi:hypothetical protein
VSREAFANKDFKPHTFQGQKMMSMYLWFSIFAPKPFLFPFLGKNKQKQTNKTYVL